MHLRLLVKNGLIYLIGPPAVDRIKNKKKTF